MFKKLFKCIYFSMYSIDRLINLNIRLSKNQKTVCNDKIAFNPLKKQNKVTVGL